MLAAIIEANHDEQGITWPAEVAPYDVHVVALNLDQPAVAAALDEVEASLRASGLSVLTDDRDDSAGIKFKDADLIGIPVRITVSPRALERGGVEVRSRRSGETSVMAVSAAVARAKEIRAARPSR
jgi:prolyl-tRNA synthetase